MSSKAKFQAIRGTRDLLPPDTVLWNHVEQTAHEVFRTFGFGEIRPPIFEPTELFARAVGGETDIVSKEMYVFEEQAGGDLLNARETLRNFAFQKGQDSSLEVAEGLSGELVARVESAVKTGELELTADGQARFDCSDHWLRGLDTARHGMILNARLPE